MPLGRHTWFPIATSARSSSGCDVGCWAIGDKLGLLGFDVCRGHGTPQDVFANLFFRVTNTFLFWGSKSCFQLLSSLSLMILNFLQAHCHSMEIVGQVMPVICLIPYQWYESEMEESFVFEVYCHYFRGSFFQWHLTSTLTINWSTGTQPKQVPPPNPTEDYEELQRDSEEWHAVSRKQVAGVTPVLSQCCLCDPEWIGFVRKTHWRSHIINKFPRRFAWLSIE